MKRSYKQLAAKILCLSMVFQLGSFPAGAVEAEIPSDTEVYGHQHTRECYGDVLTCGYITDDLASGSNAIEDEDIASDSDASHVHTKECYELECPYELEEQRKARGNIFRELEEEDQFYLGTQAGITEDKLGGQVLQIKSGWNQDRLKGVAKFNDAGSLFGKEQFTLSAYVYNQGTSEKGAAFTIGEEDQYFSINLFPAALKYSSGSGEETVSIDGQGFANEWISLVVSYEEDGTEGEVSVYVDGEELLAGTGIGFKLSELDKIEAYVGGTFADTSFMGQGAYDCITVADTAVTDGFDYEIASASDAAEQVEELADAHDFAEELDNVSTLEDAEAAIETWVATECDEFLESGMMIRPTVTAYEEQGEPYRESFEGKPGSVTFSFKLLNGGGAAETTERTEELPVTGTSGGIPVYDSFSGTADGTGSGAEERTMWLDTEGKHIQAHGGQVQGFNEQETGYDLDENGEVEDKNVWLWYGENKTRNGKPIDGVKCYVSTDLYNWTDKGTVLQTHDMVPAKLGDGEFFEDGVSLDEDALDKLKSWAGMSEPTEEVSQEDIDMAKSFVEAYEDSSSETGYDEENLQLAFWNLYTGYCIAERPKMLYNEESGQFVVVYHQDAPSGGAIKTYVKEILENGSSTNTGSRYARASMGFAVSDSPYGPFKLINVQRLNGYEEEFSAKPGMARDMNVFMDDTDIDQNGVADAYAIYSSEENKKLYISLLNAEYTGPATEGAEDTMELPDGSTIQTFATRVLSDNNREAPAVFKYDGWYYMVTSGTSGWNPNPATYYRAEHIFGPWEKMGDPCEGGSKTTFRSQSTCVFPLDAEAGQFIYMGDRWRTESNSSALWYSSYMWVPVEITEDHKIELKNVSDWNLSLFDKMTPIKVNTELPDTIEYGSATALPETVNVTRGKDTFDTPVIWELPKGLGNQSLEGTLTELGTTISIQTRVVISDAVYFADSGVANADASDYFKEIAALSADTMKNPEMPDQKYQTGSWGYVGDNTLNRNSEADIYETLRYVQKNSADHDISYRFDNLEEGTYKVLIGFYDPWYQYSKGKRTAEITVDVNGEQRGDAVSHTITDAKDMVAFQAVELPVAGNLEIDLKSVNQGNDTDVMVSYVAVCRVEDEPDVPEETYYTVNFDTNEGTEIAVQEVKEGEKAEKPEDPTRAGYVFAGWYQDAAFTAVWDFAKDTVTADTTIYAKWEKEEEPDVPEATYYTVSFDTNEGTKIATQEVKEGAKAEKPEDPTRTGYVFAGWYQDAAFTAVWDFAKDTVTADTTIYAKWEKEEEPEEPDKPDVPEATYYTVSFDTNEGTEIAAQEVKEGEKAEKPEDPTRAGYVFAGWYQDPAFTEIWDFAKDIVTADTIIYAKWERRYIPTDSSDDNDSSSSGTAASTNSAAVAPELTVTAPATAMTGQWGQSADGTWYLIKADGTKARNEWGMVSGKWYLFDQNAVMVRGWARVNNIWYYMDPVNGDMKTGWQLVNGTWYYCDPATGAMMTGRITLDGKIYNLGADGSLAE